MEKQDKTFYSKRQEFLLFYFSRNVYSFSNFKMHIIASFLNLQKLFLQVFTMKKPLKQWNLGTEWCTTSCNCVIISEICGLNSSKAPDTVWCIFFHLQSSSHQCATIINGPFKLTKNYMFQLIHQFRKNNAIMYHVLNFSEEIPMCNCHCCFFV